MNAPAERKKTRLERAAEAWEAAEREREGSPPPDLDLLREQLGDEMGQKLHELASRPPRRSVASEMEYLRLWLVYQAAKTAPLLEVLSTFTAERQFTRREWELRCDTVFPGHRHPGDRLRWLAAYRIDPCILTVRGDWVRYAQAELGEWLRVIERELAEALQSERPG